MLGHNPERKKLMVEYTCPVHPDVVLFDDDSAKRAMASATRFPKTASLRGITGIKLQSLLNSEAKPLRKEIDKLRRRDTLRLHKPTQAHVQPFISPWRSKGVGKNRLGRAIDFSFTKVRRYTHVDLGEIPGYCGKCDKSYYKYECNPRNRKR